MIIQSSKEFVLQTDAEEYLRSISYRKTSKRTEWPWLASTGLVCARVVIRQHGFRIEYMIEKEVAS